MNLQPWTPRTASRDASTRESQGESQREVRLEPPRDTQRPSRLAWRVGGGVLALAALQALGLNTAQAATVYGKVISSTPVTEQVAVPQSQCYDQPQTYQPPPSGAGALLGAVVGGVVGNQFGAGAGRAAATGLGAVAGSVVGNQVEADNTPAGVATVRRCDTVSRYETRVIGYDVVYEYQGQRYSARMPQNPGRNIALNVNVAPQQGAVQGSEAPVVGDSRSGTPVGTPIDSGYRQPVYGSAYVAPPPVVYAPVPAYGYAPYGYAPYGYAPYGYYARPPIAVVPSVSIGIGGYWRHR